MKKHLSVILTISIFSVFVLGLVACDSHSESSKKKDKATDSNYSLKVDEGKNVENHGDGEKEVNFEKLRKYIMKEGGKYKDSYTLSWIDSENDLTFMMVLEDNGEIFWHIIQETELSKTSTAMQLYEDSVIQPVLSKFEYRGKTFNSSANVVSSKFSLSNPMISSFETELPDEFGGEDFLKNEIQLMFLYAVQTLEGSNISMADLGFTSF